MLGRLTSLLAASLWLAGNATALESMSAHYGETPELRVFDGTVEAVNQATISAQVDGRVEEILYDVDDFVPQGAVVLRFRAREQEAALQTAKANLAEAQAHLQEAESEYQRIKSVFERKLIAKAKLDEVEANRKAAQARLDAASGAVTRADEQLEYTRVRAPYAGIVTQRHVEVGESVNRGQPLMSGLSLEQLRVSVWVPQRFVDAVRREQRAQIQLPDATEPVLESDHLTFFPTADAASHSFRVRVELPPGQHALYPGMLVKAGFPVGTRKRLMVPAGALVQRSELTGLYIRSGEGHIGLRQVRIGERVGDEVDILAGVEEGEQILLNPIEAAEQLKTQPAE